MRNFSLSLCEEVLWSSSHRVSIDDIDLGIFSLDHAFEGICTLTFTDLLDSPLFSETERCRARCFAAQHQARYWLLSRLLLRFFLAEKLRIEPQNIVFSLDSWGKPRIQGIEFSLSRSADYLALAASESKQRIGIDIEKVQLRSDYSRLLSYFHPEEQKELKEIPTPDLPLAFTRLWTRKEAYLKAVGTGLLQGLSKDYTGTDKNSLLPQNTALLDIQHPDFCSYPVSLAVIEP